MSPRDGRLIWEEAYFAWKEENHFRNEEQKPQENGGKRKVDKSREKNELEQPDGAQDKNGVPEYAEAQDGSTTYANSIHRAELYPRSSSAPPTFVEPKSSISPPIPPATPIPRGIITPSTPTLLPRQEPYGLAIEQYGVIARNLVLPSITIHDFIQLMGGSPHRHGLRIWIQSKTGFRQSWGKDGLVLYNPAKPHLTLTAAGWALGRAAGPIRFVLVDLSGCTDVEGEGEQG